MAKISVKLIPPEFDEHYNKALQSGDRFQYSVIKTKRLFTSRNYKKGLSQKSLFPTLAPVWNSLDASAKSAWGVAGAVEGLTGWREFIKNTALRLVNGGSGYATPSDLYQSNVGRISVASPSSNFTIEQLHPNTYYVLKKVRGTKSQFNPLLIQEYLTLPFTIGLSYCASLSASGGTPRARFYVEIYSHYQGRDITTVLEIPFILDNTWRSGEATISQTLGIVRGYTAFIQIENARGDLYFDNVRLEHSGINYARDPHCNNINVTYTKAFYQIPKAWDAEVIPENCFFDSFYYDILA